MSKIAQTKGTITTFNVNTQTSIEIPGAVLEKEIATAIKAFILKQFGLEIDFNQATIKVQTTNYDDPDDLEDVTFKVEAQNNKVITKPV